MKKFIAIIAGEPNSISSEIIFKTWLSRKKYKYKPYFVCIVPEKRHEVTTENGLNVKKNKRILKKMVQKLIIDKENAKKTKKSPKTRPKKNNTRKKKKKN